MTTPRTTPTPDLAPSPEVVLHGLEGASEAPPLRGAAKVIHLIEDTVARTLFVLMFGTLIVGVFWRYVLDQPLTWTVNVAALAFLWMVLIGAGLPNWADDHIQFDLIYERFGRRVQLWMQLVGNLIIVVPCLLILPSSVEYVQSLGSQSVTGTPVTFATAFSVIVAFFAATALHRGRIAVLVALELGGRGKAPT